MSEEQKAYALVEQKEEGVFKIVGAKMCSGHDFPGDFAYKCSARLAEEGVITVIDLSQGYHFITVSPTAGAIRIRPLHNDKLSTDQADQVFENLLSAATETTSYTLDDL